jgi:hypothetical protein
VLAIIWDGEFVAKSEEFEVDRKSRGNLSFGFAWRCRPVTSAPRTTTASTASTRFRSLGRSVGLFCRSHLQQSGSRTAHSAPTASRPGRW